MGFLSLLGDRQASTPGPTDDFWYTQPSSVSDAGVAVTPQLALQVSTVFACVNVIAETLASIPLDLFERLDENARRKATDQHLHHVLHEQPNGVQTAFDFVYDMTAWCVLHRAAYAQIVSGPRGAVEALIPIHPERVTPERLPNGRLRFQVLQVDGTRRPFTQDEIFWFRGFSLDGMNGYRISEHAKQAIGLARAAESYGALFFKNSANPAGVLEMESTFKDQKALDRLRADWMSRYANGQQHRPAILEGGMKWKAMSYNARDSQMLESREYQVADMCRYFRMPPHKVQHLVDVKYASMEQSATEFLTDTMLPWAGRWEAAIKRDLIVDTSRYYAEFMLQAIARGDMAARGAFYNQLFHLGSISPNEIRQRENMDPVAGGDRRFVPLNMVALDAVGDDGVTGQGASDAAPTHAPQPPAAPAAPAAPAPPSRRRPNRGAFAGLIADVAERLAAGEAGALERKVGRAQDDRARFDAWATGFLEEQRPYVTRAITPLLDTWARLADCPVAVEPLVHEITQRGRSALAVHDVATVVAAWRSTRIQTITAIITEAFDDAHDQ